MALIKEDFYPRKPTRATLLAALPAFATAAYALASPLIGRADDALLLVSLELPFLALLAIAGSAASSDSRFVKWFGITWALVIAVAVASSMAFAIGTWTPLLGIAFVLAAHSATLVRRDRWIVRSLLTVRSALLFLAGWGLLFAAFSIVALSGIPIDPWGTSLWAALLFALVGTLDLLRILEPPPADAGPNWWKWDGDQSAERS